MLTQPDQEVVDTFDAAVDPAMKILGPQYDSPEARVLLFAIGLQESKLEFRRQHNMGPAKGLWQFEKNGGVRGIYTHRASRTLLSKLCAARNVDFDVSSMWDALEEDDVFAAGCARLLLLTDPYPLPAIDDTDGAWILYKDRLWRPGKPHPKEWPDNHEQAQAYIEARGAHPQEEEDDDSDGDGEGA